MRRCWQPVAVLFGLMLLLLCGCEEGFQAMATPEQEQIEVRTYRVEYIDQDGAELARAKVGSASAGTEVVERPPVIPGYSPLERELRATMKERDDLVLRFYYEPMADSSRTESAVSAEPLDGVWRPVLFIGGMTLLLILVFVQAGRSRRKK